MSIRKELIDLQENPTVCCTPAQVKGKLNNLCIVMKCDGDYIESAWEWKVLLRGPVGSPYEGGEFSFHVK
jgi:ubiquitin-protein ligase